MYGGCLSDTAGKYSMQFIVHCMEGIVTLTALKYFCLNHGDQMCFQCEIITNVLISSFRFI